VRECVSATSKIDDMVPRVRLMSLSNLIWQHTARSLAREVVMEHGSSTFCIFAVTSSETTFYPSSSLMVYSTRQLGQRR